VIASGSRLPAPLLIWHKGAILVAVRCCAAREQLDYGVSPAIICKSYKRHNFMVHASKLADAAWFCHRSDHRTGQAAPQRSRLHTAPGACKLQLRFGGIIAGAVRAATVLRR
jgi:hypothetical protein